MPDQIFLYGTLLPDLASDALLAVVRALCPVGRATIHGRLYDLGAYPAAVLENPGDSRVVGQVFELPDDPTVLARLDRYEDCFPDRPSEGLYRRVRQGVTLGDGKELEAWVYVYNRDLGSAPLVPGGDYAVWKSGK